MVLATHRLQCRRSSTRERALLLERGELGVGSEGNSRDRRRVRDHVFAKPCSPPNTRRRFARAWSQTPERHLVAVEIDDPVRCEIDDERVGLQLDPHQHRTITTAAVAGCGRVCVRPREALFCKGLVKQEAREPIALGGLRRASNRTPTGRALRIRPSTVQVQARPPRSPRLAVASSTNRALDATRRIHHPRIERLEDLLRIGSKARSASQAALHYPRWGLAPGRRRRVSDRLRRRRLTARAPRPSRRASVRTPRNVRPLGQRKRRRAEGFDMSACDKRSFMTRLVTMDLELRGRRFLVTGGEPGASAGDREVARREGAVVAIVARGADALETSARSKPQVARRARHRRRRGDISRARTARLKRRSPRWAGSTARQQRRRQLLGARGFDQVDEEAPAAGPRHEPDVRRAHEPARGRGAEARDVGGADEPYRSICGREYCTSAPYVAAKAALTGLTKEMGINLAKHRIRRQRGVPRIDPLSRRFWTDARRTIPRSSRRWSPTSCLGVASARRRRSPTSSPSFPPAQSWVIEGLPPSSTEDRGGHSETLDSRHEHRDLRIAPGGDARSLPVGSPFVFERVDQKPMTFAPGQWFNLFLPHEGQELRRPYSIASHPDGSARFELTVTRVPGDPIRGASRDAARHRAANRRSTRPVHSRGDDLPRGALVGVRRCRARAIAKHVEGQALVAPFTRR